MCFTKEWSITFTFSSFAIAAWVFTGKGIWKNLKKWQTTRIAVLFIYFALMEFLQFFQYLVIDECENKFNKFLTVLGWFHICFQPYFSNLGFSALDTKNQNEERKEVWKVVLRITAASGFFMALRVIVPYFTTLQEGHFVLEPCSSRDEVMCSEKTCTESGVYHLKWLFYLVKPSYVFPTIAVHFITMFVTPVILGLHWASIILFITGPGLTLLFVKAHPAELASIWCFFSIGEAAITIATQYYAVRKAAEKLKTK